MSDAFRDELSNALGQNYSIDRELSGGGMSRVFVATERGLNRTVVVKVLKPDLAADVNRERFRREIMVVAQLQHPHIVPVLNAGQAGELLWYTMPFVEGESLRETLRRGVTMKPRDVVRVLHDVLDALDYAHARGVVHRDIKPGNILRHRAHSLVTDFGVAKALSAAMPHSGTTSAGMAIGTPAYMAPEQLAADPKADHRMDLYAVGLLAYELLTGTQPFQASSPQETLAAQLTRMPTPLDEVRSDLPPQLTSLITRLLAKNPDQRPRSAAAALDELDALTTPSDATPSRAWTGTGGAPVRASRTRAFVVAGTLLAAMVLAIGIWAGERDQASPAASATTPASRSDSVTRPAASTIAGGVGSSTGASTREALNGTRQSGTQSAPVVGSGGGGGAAGTASKTTAVETKATTARPRPAPASGATKAAPASASLRAPTPRASAPARFAVPRRVAVIPARWTASRPELAATARALTDSLRRSFIAAGYTLASDADLVQLLAQPPGTSPRRAADAIGVGAVVTSDVTVRGSEIRASTLVFDVWRNGHLSSTEATDPDKPLEVLGVVRDATRSLDRVSWRRPDSPRLVLVFNVDNLTGTDTLDALARAIGDAARSTIARELQVGIVRDTAALAATDAAERREVGIRQLAGALVAVSLRSFRRDSVTLRLTVRDMSEDVTFPPVDTRIAVAAGAEGAEPLLGRAVELLQRVNWGPRRGR